MPSGHKTIHYCNILIINTVGMCYMVAILLNRELAIQVVDLVMCETHCAVLVEDECRTVCNAASRESHFGDVRLWLLLLRHIYDMP